MLKNSVRLLEVHIAPLHFGLNALHKQYPEQHSLMHWFTPYGVNSGKWAKWAHLAAAHLCSIPLFVCFQTISCNSMLPQVNTGNWVSSGNKVNTPNKSHIMQCLMNSLQQVQAFLLATRATLTKKWCIWPLHFKGHPWLHITFNYVMLQFWKQKICLRFPIILACVPYQHKSSHESQFSCCLSYIMYKQIIKNIWQLLQRNAKCCS